MQSPFGPDFVFRYERKGMPTITPNPWDIWARWWGEWQRQPDSRPLVVISVEPPRGVAAGVKLGGFHTRPAYSTSRVDPEKLGVTLKHSPGGIYNVGYWGGAQSPPLWGEPWMYLAAPVCSPTTSGATPVEVLRRTRLTKEEAQLLAKEEARRAEALASLK